MSRRRPLAKPSPKMVDDALAALHKAVLDPDTGDTARVSAARALSRRTKAEQAEADEGAARPRVGTLLIMPMNHRDDYIKAGISGDGSRVDIDCRTAESRAQGDLDIAEARRRIASASKPLALVASPAKRIGPKTDAEKRADNALRQKRFRERRAARLAAA